MPQCYKVLAAATAQLFQLWGLISKKKKNDDDNTAVRTNFVSFSLRRNEYIHPFIAETGLNLVSCGPLASQFVDAIGCLNERVKM